MPFGMILFCGGVACLWGLWKIGFALWGAGVLVLFVFGLCVVGLMGGAWLCC